MKMPKRKTVEESHCALSSVSTLTMDAAVQYDIVDSEYVSIKPLGPVNGSVIEFQVENNGSMLTDLQSSDLEVVWRVKKIDGTNCADTDKVTVVNYIGATMWFMISMKLNGEMVTQRAPNQAFRAMAEVLTSYGKSATNSWLEAGLFYKDTSGKMDEKDPEAAEGNKGLAARFKHTKGSKRVVTRSKLHTEMFSQPKPLINFVTMSLTLHKNKDEYLIMSNSSNAYKIEIEDIQLRLRRIKVADSIYRSLALSSIVYPISEVRTREFLTHAGGKSWYIPNVSTGKLPQRMIMGFCSHDAVSGDSKMNPFNFKNCGLSSLAVVVNGNTIDGAPLELDYSTDQYMSAFWSLQTNTGKAYKNDGMIISRNDFKDGYALYAFDLSPSKCDNQYRDPDQSGDINIDCKFQNALTESTTLCVYMQYESTITINAQKRVTMNYVA